MSLSLQAESRAQFKRCFNRRRPGIEQLDEAVTPVVGLVLRARLPEDAVTSVGVRRDEPVCQHTLQFHHVDTEKLACSLDTDGTRCSANKQAERDEKRCFSYNKFAYIHIINDITSHLKN